MVALRKLIALQAGLLIVLLLAGQSAAHNPAGYPVHHSCHFMPPNPGCAVPSGSDGLLFAFHNDDAVGSHIVDVCPIIAPNTACIGPAVFSECVAPNSFASTSSDSSGDYDAPFGLTPQPLGTWETDNGDWAINWYPGCFPCAVPCPPLFTAVVAVH